MRAERVRTLDVEEISSKIVSIVALWAGMELLGRC